jgi:hypothetical protein
MTVVTLWANWGMRFPAVLFPGLVLFSTLIQAAPRTQAPDAAWITFTTRHYRIHCPKAFETFGRDVAGRVEGIHAQYLGLIGFRYEQPIDILILDPVLEANGSAWPFLQRPFVILWKTEPDPDSAIGHHRGWAELLLAHELGHMHHLLRPARKPTWWQRGTAILGPLAEKSPRWVIEGYATLLEGELTGTGRPHSAIRAAVLRQWAMEGRLPDYEALSGTKGFLGGSMAYLGGSAYLAWLEAKASDPKILQSLWIRLAGPRDFEAAFTATFGFGPKEGYQRFCAELTHTALDLERRVRAEGLREGEVVTQLKGWATDLALSPDGSLLLARVLDPKKPGLYVWDLKASAPRPAKQHPDEPVDHALLAPILPLAHRLGRVDGALPWKPVWTASNAVGFQLRLPDAEGVLQPQPRQWTFGKGVSSSSFSTNPVAVGGPSWKEVDGIWNLVDTRGRPLTRTLAAAWNPVATPDGKWIYYTQLSATGLQIRRLDATLPPLETNPLPRDPEPLVWDAILPKADSPTPLPPPEPIDAHPYSIRESHDTLFLTGLSDTPSGASAQFGVGGNDLIGRLNWQVLAGMGDGAGPRGALAGAAWRGWRWAPSLQAFSILERPDRQRFFAPEPGFDRERRGVELAFEAEDLGRPRSQVRPVIAFERVAPTDAHSFSRSLVGLAAKVGNLWSRNDQGFHAGLAVQEQQGRSDGQSWNLARGALTVGWINPWAPLTLCGEEGRIGGDPTPLDRFHLGGVATSLLPSSLDANRVLQAALPAYSATGNRLQRLRGELGLGVFRAYVEHTAVWQDSAARPSAQRVAGLELDSRNLGLPMDLMRRLMGGLSFTVGLHRPLDGIMKDRTVGTLSVIVRP